MHDQEVFRLGLPRIKIKDLYVDKPYQDPGFSLD